MREKESNCNKGKFVKSWATIHHSSSAQFIEKPGCNSSSYKGSTGPIGKSHYLKLTIVRWSIPQAQKMLNKCPKSYGKWNNYQFHGQMTKRRKNCFKRERWVDQSSDKTIGVCLVQRTKKSLKLGITFALQKYAFCYHKAFPNLKSLHRNLLGVQHMMIQILGLAKMPNAHNGICKNARRSWFHKMRQKIWSKYLNVYQVAKGSQ